MAVKRAMKNVDVLRIIAQKSLTPFIMAKLTNTSH